MSLLILRIQTREHWLEKKNHKINLNRLMIASKKFVIFSQVLVHGEQNEMGRLKAALIREYEDNPVSYARAMFCKY